MSLRPLLVAGSSLIVLLVACGGGVATIGNSSGDGSSGGGSSSGSSGTSGSSGGSSGSSGSSGTSGSSGVVSTCSTNVLPGKRACVPGTARAGAQIDVTVDTDEGCLGCFTTYAPCQVNVVGMDITIAMMTTTCTPTGTQSCPAICQVPRTTCQIPPLAAGTYNVQVTGEPQPSGSSRQLVVTNDATATSCTLPPEGSTPPALDGSKYGTSCSSDTDCIAVVTGDMCSPCSCPNTAIATSADASYEADARAARSQCIWNGGPVACAACFAAMPRCITSPDALTGMCVLGGIK